MPTMRIILEEPAWPDLGDIEQRMHDGRVIWLGNGAHPIAIAALKGGMTSGKPSVAIRLDLPDGRTVIAETSLTLLLAAAETFRTRFGDPRT